MLFIEDHCKHLNKYSLSVNMDFSVIVPAYNREHYIKETLDSILSQTHPPAEIIVVDDGSTDGTASLVRRYGPSIRLIEIKNSGAAAARHIGVLASQCQYLAFCDSDDIWQPNHLEKLSILLSNGAVQFAFSNFRHFTNCDKSLGTHFESDASGFWMSPGRKIAPSLFISEQPIFENVLNYQAIFQSCFAIHKDWYMQIGGYDAAFGRMVSEDLEFVLRCAKFANAGVCTHPTVEIRRHEGNHSGDWIKCLFGSIDILKHSARQHGLPNEWVALIDEQVKLRSVEGINTSFLLKQFLDTVHFGKNLEWSSLNFKQKLKLAIANLPSPIAQFLHKVVTN